MATTQLSDIPIIPQIFSNSIILESLKADAFVDSGIAVVDPDINAFLNSSVGGRTYNPRFIGPLGDDDANISNDNPADLSSPLKIAGFLNTAVRQQLNQSWSAMDLVTDLNADDPLKVVSSQIAKYWTTQRQKRVLASVKGIVKNNADMVHNVINAMGTAAYMNPDVIIDAGALLGDSDKDLMIMAVHPVVLATMKKLNLIETEHYADQNITIHRYLGYRIVQDDQMTTDIAASVTTGVDDKGDAITETNVTTYYSYLFGPGAIALGYGTPRIPFEVDRNPAAGKGGGQETVYSRVDWVIHPQGYSYSTTAGVTIAALETGTNWTRAWERKRIKFIAIRTLG